MRADEFFDTRWPVEQRRLRGMLARHGVARDDIDDVLQETATRLYLAWGRVFEDQPVSPLITTIALNTARDFHRRSLHRPRLVSTLPERPMSETASPDHAVMARLEVSRTARAMAHLSVEQRRTVVDAVTDELTSEQAGRQRAPASIRMARTRARRQLVAILELTAASAGVVLGLARRTTSSPVTSAAALVTVGAAAFYAIGVAGPNGPSSSHPQAGEASVEAFLAHTTGGSSSPASAVQYLSEPAGSWVLTGASHWWPSSGQPLLAASAFGKQSEVGDWRAGHMCSVSVVDRITVAVRCAPIV